ncbi:MAG: hypothetical protein V7L14_16410 [Nostoc sp.]|uniref:hypothetical protein n=1 Tax=Nostoc sp. TaxID=1180 RepID=UPI002FFA6250
MPLCVASRDASASPLLTLGEASAKGEEKALRCANKILALFAQRLVEKKKTGGDVALASRRVADEGDEKISMPNAQCPMPNAQCPMPNAQCPMPNAQCPMPND